MFDAMTIAASGLQANSAQLSRIASNIAGMQGTGSDLAAQMTGLIEARAGFRANLATLRSANDMMGALLDISV